MVSLICESEKAELRETENRVLVTRGGGWEKWEVLVTGYKLPVVRLTNSGELMYSMVITANNTALYT